MYMYLRQFARQIKSIVRQAAEHTPSFVSMTLDLDDARLAKNWLRRKEDWRISDKCQQYHSRFADWNGSKFAYSFLGGRASLSAIIAALELKPGDEVIVPGYTCVVVPNAFQYAGVRLEYCDIELDTYGLDGNLIESKIKKQTKAILLHHLYGLVCRDYELILTIARRHGLYVIEDCSHSTGAEYKGQKVGNRGDLAFYSSERSKVFNTLIGGIAITNTPSIASKLEQCYFKAPECDYASIEKQLKNLITSYYQLKHPGYVLSTLNARLYRAEGIISTTREEENGIRPFNYGQKMPNPIAAIAVNQLNKIDSYNARRRETAKQWDNWCVNQGYKKPLVVPDSVPVFLRYPVLVEAEKKVDRSWARKELGLDIGVWFLSHLHPTKRQVLGCPNATIAVQRCINLPTLLS
jgi:perosamine synthetase